MTEYPTEGVKMPPEPILSLTEHLKRARRKRWDAMTPEARRAYAMKLVAAREAKRKAPDSTGA